MRRRAGALMSGVAGRLAPVPPVRRAKADRPASRARAGLAGVLLATTFLVAAPTHAADQPALAEDPLVTGFKIPPPSARPRVWWHWMNGNVTKDGIAKDLDWMARIGIGGLQAFDANLTTPQIVPNRLAYMTPGWKEAFRFAASKADALGLEMAIASSAGWSETGGPWVTPQDAMKKLTWSETAVRGGKRFAGVLPRPPGVTGPFLDVQAEQPADVPNVLEQKPLPQHYEDIAVVAYRAAKAEATPTPRVSLADGKPIDAARLVDGQFGADVEVPRGTAQQPTIIRLDFERAQRVRSVSIFLPGVATMFAGTPIRPWLEVGDESGGWRKIAELKPAMAPTTVSFAPVTSKRFRVVLGHDEESAKLPFTPAEGFDMSALGALFAPKATLKVAELRLSAEARINHFEEKAGYAVAGDYYALDKQVGGEVEGASPSEVIDLTRRMAADGRLDWSPPKGDWRILRIGYSLVGKTNHPATAEATGLEVDKIDAAAVRRYLEIYLGMYRDAVGPDLLGERGVRALLTDSTEVGAFNWTPGLLDHFRRLRGYDARPWLPTLTGAIVGSRAQSDGFLYDFRRTLADLHASEHYGTVAKVAHENKLLVYGEALESERGSLGDDMDMRRYADVPMAALWTYGREELPRITYLADMRGAASTAHLFGGNIVAAESLTSAFQPWAHAPSDLRRVVDLEFANGVNRPVIHTSVHQPVDDKQPGLSLLIFGQYFNRHDTWAEMAKPWVEYLSRSSHLLQQGRFFADVAYFYGEEAPTIAQVKAAYFTDTPKHYAYDFVNPRAVHGVLNVEGGDLVAKSGARYRALYLGGTSQRMTLAMLRRIARLAEDGATIVGRAPEGSPALGDDPAQYRALVGRLWSGSAVTKVGSGQVIASGDIESALAQIGVRPDFELAQAQPDSEVLFVHRRLDQGDLYFVNNRKNRSERVEARFRVTGRTPEIWRADTGAIEPVSFRTEGDVTVVPLEMDAEGSFFVVFRAPATASSATVARPGATSVADLSKAWTVSFQPGRGAPASIELAVLGPLSEQAEPGVKYFSGVSTYTKSFSLPRSTRAGDPLLLDLGAVGDIAEVSVNGTPVGTAWRAPYRLDIGAAVKPGANSLKVKVANVWVNRLIGDAQPGAQKVTFTTIPTYAAGTKLRPSGLIGPVQLLKPDLPKRP